jgi:hypothetical protein
MLIMFRKSNGEEGEENKTMHIFKTKLCNLCRETRTTDKLTIIRSFKKELLRRKNT